MIRLSAESRYAGFAKVSVYEYRALAKEFC
jgi:hypothetical protein